MFNGYRIVCVTPAGRRRYLDLLVRYVLESPVVDEYQLWRNTTEISDIQYLYEVQKTSSKVTVIEPTLRPPTEFKSISQFFRNCTDQNAIYVRFDDDIVYLEDKFFEKFLRFRIENPHYFLVFPNVINNSICTYLLFTRGVINPGGPIHPWCMDSTTWGNPHFAEQLHKAFLQSVAHNEVSSWYFGTKLLALNRFSINCMAWFGADFAEFQGVVPEAEEAWLSVIKPSELMRPNCIYGDAIVAHFAFYSQREYLDTTNILQLYESLRPDRRAKPVANVGQHCCQSADMRPQPAVSGIWMSRLTDTIERLMQASSDELSNVKWIEEQIRWAGLAQQDRWSAYGSDIVHMNVGAFGLDHIPVQLAQCLVKLSDYRISTIVYLGGFSAWTIFFMAAYLRRSNESLSVVAVGDENVFSDYPAIKRLLAIDFLLGKASKDFIGQAFDLAVFRRPNANGWCFEDYEAVQRKASICMFHDIDDRFLGSAGSRENKMLNRWRTLLLRELRAKTLFASEVFEYLDHPDGDHVMGIGLIARDHATRRGRLSIWNRMVARRIKLIESLARVNQADVETQGQVFPR